MKTNDIQIGGDHYKMDYQHWDLVIELNIPYLFAVATKYITRWRSKNGIQDLKKSIHYIQKMQETEHTLYQHSWVTTEHARNRVDAFVEQFSYEIDKRIVRLILQAKYDQALELINGMIYDMGENRYGIIE